MKFYVDVTLLPSADLSPYFLWSKIYRQVHLALVGMKLDGGCVPIGVAFPEYDDKKKNLGVKLRLLATEEKLLIKLNVCKWLSRFSDYVHITGIRAVPERVKKYVVYKRKQPEISFSKFRRAVLRKAKRESITLTDAEKSLEPMLHRSNQTVVSEPYIQLISDSSGEKFCLFITKQAADGASEYLFNTYGFGAAVPEF